jgi:hypothetical protein
MHRACAALGDTTAKFGTGQIKIFTQYPQQWFVRWGIGSDGFAVQCETYHVDVSCRLCKQS